MGAESDESEADGKVRSPARTKTGGRTARSPAEQIEDLFEVWEHARRNYRAAQAFVRWCKDGGAKGPLLQRAEEDLADVTAVLMSAMRGQALLKGLVQKGLRPVRANGGYNVLEDRVVHELQACLALLLEAWDREKEPFSDVTARLEPGWLARLAARAGRPLERFLDYIHDTKTLAHSKRNSVAKLASLMTSELLRISVTEVERRCALVNNANPMSRYILKVGSDATLQVCRLVRKPPGEDATLLHLPPNLITTARKKAARRPR